SDAADSAASIGTAVTDAQDAATLAGQHKDAAETARTGAETAQAAAEQAAQDAQEAANVGPATDTTAGIVRLPGNAPGVLGGTSNNPTVTGWDDKADADHDHSADDIWDATTVGIDVLRASNQQAARDVIGAGTSNLQLGSSGSTAAPGDHTHGPGEITGVTPTGQSLMEAADGAAARSAIGAGTSSLELGSGANNAAPGNHTHVAAQIDDATTVGKNVLTAADMQTARDSIGLSNVDNTSDAEKPVSTAVAYEFNQVANALADKVDSGDVDEMQLVANEAAALSAGTGVFAFWTE
ncbi:hypothetical protein, partial [Hoyosella altamirensis]